MTPNDPARSSSSAAITLRGLSAIVLIGVSLAAGATPPVAATDPSPATGSADAAPPAAPAARVKVGEEIPYEAQADYIGARVRVTTRLSQREGVLAGTSTMGFNLQVGPARISVPIESVVKVVLLAEAPAQP